MSEQREKDGRRVLGNREGFRMVEGGCVLEGSKHDDESKHAHTHGVPRGILKYFQAHHDTIHNCNFEHNQKHHRKNRHIELDARHQHDLDTAFRRRISENEEGDGPGQHDVDMALLRINTELPIKTKGTLSRRRISVSEGGGGESKRGGDMTSGVLPSSTSFKESIIESYTDLSKMSQCAGGRAWRRRHGIIDGWRHGASLEIQKHY
jgi:hypothetical protein